MRVHGVEVPIMALQKCAHVFASDNNKEVRKTIRTNHIPEILYEDIQGRDVNKVTCTDLYIVSFPCQPFSTMGRQEGFDDTQDTISQHPELYSD